LSHVLQVLKDLNTAESYNMADGDIVHVVTVSTPGGQAASAPAIASASAVSSASSAPASVPAAAPAPALAAAAQQPAFVADPFAALLGSAQAGLPHPGANPFAAMMGGMDGTGMPDMASMHAMLQQNPEMMGAIMDNPMVQQALDNPGKIAPIFSCCSSLTPTCSNHRSHDASESADALDYASESGSRTDDARSCIAAAG
jgi:hypothetical protein